MDKYFESSVVAFLLGAGISQGTIIIDENFSSPEYVNGSVVGQQGWRGQMDRNNFSVDVTAGTATVRGSDSLGITNAAVANVSRGEVLRMQVDFRIKLGADTTKPLMIWGFTGNPNGLLPFGDSNRTNNGFRAELRYNEFPLITTPSLRSGQGRGSLRLSSFAGADPDTERANIFGENVGISPHSRLSTVTITESGIGIGEVQSITPVIPSAASNLPPLGRDDPFRLKFNGRMTLPLTLNSSVDDVRNALNTLGNDLTAVSVTENRGGGFDVSFLNSLDMPTIEGVDELVDMETDHLRGEFIVIKTSKTVDPDITPITQFLVRSILTNLDTGAIFTDSFREVENLNNLPLNNFYPAVRSAGFSEDGNITMTRVLAEHFSSDEDPDNDGFTNMEEIDAGTNPLNEASSPRVLFLDTFSDVNGASFDLPQLVNGEPRTSAIFDVGGPEGFQNRYIAFDPFDSNGPEFRIKEDNETLGPDGFPGILSLEVLENGALRGDLEFSFTGVDDDGNERMDLSGLTSEADLAEIFFSFNYRAVTTRTSGLLPFTARISNGSTSAAASAGGLMATDEWQLFSAPLSDLLIGNALISSLEGEFGTLRLSFNFGNITGSRPGDILMLDNIRVGTVLFVQPPASSNIPVISNLRFSDANTLSFSVSGIRDTSYEIEISPNLESAFIGTSNFVQTDGFGSAEASFSFREDAVPERFFLRVSQ